MTPAAGTNNNRLNPTFEFETRIDGSNVVQEPAEAKLNHENILEPNSATPIQNSQTPTPGQAMS
jgi:hypothetical protein